MNLKDFVEETINQIASGVVAAQKHATGTESGVIINPKGTTTSTRGQLILSNDKTARSVQEIDFDVAVTVSDGTTTRGGIGVFVGPVGLGAQGKSEATNQSVSRIKFSVPIMFPFGATER